MANTDSTRLDENEIYDYQYRIFTLSTLIKSETSWGYDYEGSKSELIDSGLLYEGWFPGDSGNNKTSLKICFDETMLNTQVRNDRFRPQPGQRCLNVLRPNSSSNRFIVRDLFTKSIQLRKAAEYREQRNIEKQNTQAEEEYKLAKRLEERELKNRVNNIAEAKERVSKQYEAIAAVLNGTYFELCNSGYVQSDIHINKLKSILADLNEAFEEVTFKHDPKQRVRADTDLKHKTAKSNLKFNQFLKSLINV